MLQSVKQPSRSSEKLSNLKPYVFALLDQRVHQLQDSGVRDIVDLGKADPDHPTPDLIVERMRQEVQNPNCHHYPEFRGSDAFRRTVAHWYKRRFDVDINPDTEVLALIGSKEGLFHIALAYLSHGDIALVPDPAFPAYNDGVWFAGGETFRMPLTHKNGWLPELDNIDSITYQKAKLMFLNYPNNPTGVLAPETFLKQVIAKAQDHQFLICYDHAYSEVTYGEYKAQSILQFEGAKDVAVEFMTFSKTYNMPGWRLGAAVGNPEAIQSLLVVQSHVNSGVFTAIQLAGVTALEQVWPTSFITESKREYERRCNYGVKTLKRIGWPIEAPQGAVYLWVPTPSNMTGDELAEHLLEDYHVVVSPGSCFGNQGIHHFRISLTASYEHVVQGMDRIADCLSKYQPSYPPHA